MSEEVEDKFAPLIALAADKARRLELLTPENLKLAARFMNRDPQRYALFLGRLSAWESFSFFKTQVTRRSAINKRNAKEEKESAEAMERLAKAENDGLSIVHEGHPTSIARDFLAQVRPHLMVTGGSWLDYVDNHYREFEKATIRADLQRWLDHAVNHETGKKALVNKTVLDNVMDALANHAHLPADTVRPPTWLEPGENDPPATNLIACHNGLLDVTTEALYPNTPRFYTRAGLPYDYEDPCFVLPPYEFLHFLEEVWPEDEGGQANKDALQDWFGYLLRPGNTFQKILLLMGESRAGKGVILNLIAALVGAFNVASVSFDSLAGEFGLAPLLGKSVMIVPDLVMGKESTKAAGNILAISGDDVVGINRKYREAVNERLPIRMVLATNFPTISLPDQSGALANRLHPLIFTKSFKDREDPQLAARIIANELPGLLHWALAGLRRVNERGHLVLTPSGERVLQGMRHQSGPVSTFVKERCVLDPEALVPKDALWRAFEGYCLDLDISTTRYSPETFGRDLTRNATGFTRVTVERVKLDGRTVRVFRGIRLTEEAAGALAEDTDDY